MSVSKEKCELYRITTAGDYATICVSEVATPDGERTRYGGEILISSSYGDYCNTWVSCAKPFKEFLVGLEFTYFMQKCRQHDYLVFDGAASFKLLREQLIDERRDGITRERAREVWDALNENKYRLYETSESFVHVLSELEDTYPDVYSLKDGHEYVSLKPGDESVGFWTQLWPEFKRALEAELEHAKAAQASSVCPLCSDSGSISPSQSCICAC